MGHEKCPRMTVKAYKNTKQEDKYIFKQTKRDILATKFLHLAYACEECLNLNIISKIIYIIIISSIIVIIIIIIVIIIFI